jgi:hypothetical protein
MESLQEKSNPNFNLISLHETFINKNDYSKRGSRKLQYDPFYPPWEEEDFSQIPKNSYLAHSCSIQIIFPNSTNARDHA